MTALAADRITARRIGAQHEDPVAAGKVLYVGALAVLDAAGNLAPATAATGLTARGVVQEAVDNSAGAAGAVTGKTATGVFRFANAGDVDRTFIGKPAYALDDQTVSSSSNANTRSVVGTIDDVDADGVWVAVGIVTGIGY
ncbi:MAG: hypothetical protein QJR02_08335 [Sinobacteraceae bacterium]|nr:hypothetical protein [Nevskiaceae bacterium]